LKRRDCLLGAALFAAGVAGCARKEAEDDLDRIRQARHLYVAIQPVNVPFGFSAGIKIIGLDADLAEAISQKINVPIRWVKKEFNELFDILEQRKADLIVSVITITEERKKRFAFSDAYFQSGQIIAIRKEDEKQITGLNSLKGRKIGVQGQTTGHIFARKEPRLKDSQLVTYASLDDALLKLAEHEVDAVIGDFPILVNSLEESFTNLLVIGRPLTNERYGVVLRKDEPKLLQLVNDTIRELKAQGKLEEMGHKWFKNYSKIQQLQRQVPAPTSR
jgi:polar amino acid transport system substrate-binding protein